MIFVILAFNLWITIKICSIRRNFSNSANARSNEEIRSTPTNLIEVITYACKYNKKIIRILLAKNLIILKQKLSYKMTIKFKNTN